MFDRLFSYTQALAASLQVGFAMNGKQALGHFIPDSTVWLCLRDTGELKIPVASLPNDWSLSFRHVTAFCQFCVKPFFSI